MILHLDLGNIFDAHDQAKALAYELLSRSAEDLAAMTYSKVVELAQSQLHTSREEYLRNLSYEQASPGTWTVTLNANAMWIEEGMPKHEMVDDLLKNGRISKKTGARYKVIPFPIKGAAATAPAALPIKLAAMGALKRAKIDMKSVQRDADGRPIVGTLHKLDVMDKPLKTSGGSYQGWGQVGQVRQGATGIPFLQGLRVTQRQIGVSSTNIQKTALTFRTVSSFHKGSGRWVHPGVKARKLLDQAYSWAQNEWESTIKPEIIDAINGAMQS